MKMSVAEEADFFLVYPCKLHYSLFQYLIFGILNKAFFSFIVPDYMLTTNRVPR